VQAQPSRPSYTHQLVTYGRVHSDFEACKQYANPTT
jgi:hypothetical protein